MQEILNKLTAYRDNIQLAPFALLQQLTNKLGSYKLIGAVDYGGEAIVLKVQDASDPLYHIALKVALQNFQAEGERVIKQGVGKEVEKISSLLKMFQKKKSLHTGCYTFNAKKQRFLEGCKLQRRVSKYILHENVEFFKVPNVLQVSEKPLFLSMEFVESVGILRYLKENNKTLHESLTLFLYLLDAVYFLHKKDVIHRDLKSENIMIGRNEAKQDIPVLLDFTVAKEIGDRNLTVCDSFIGTTSYMSPKSLAGCAKDYTFCDDILSLGLMLFEFSTREKIPQYLTVEDIQKKSKSEIYNLFCQYRDRLANSIVAPLKGVFLKATAPEEVDRYNLVVDMRADLVIAISKLGFKEQKILNLKAERQEEARKLQKVKDFFYNKCNSCSSLCKMGFCYSLALQQLENLKFFMEEELL